MTTQPSLVSLGRYSISLIASYLQECDGTCFLITTRRLARTLLPIFRLPPTINEAKNRHCFVEYAAQDPPVLLQRLNTRRLRKRLMLRSRKICYEYHKTTTQLAESEAQQPSSCCWPPALQLLRFLKSSSKTIPTLLVSYPRSGNTLLRTLLERLTGIVTGSDTRPDRKLSRDLALRHDLVGEGLVRQCWVVKSHYPERSGFPLESRRVILLVRNPYDCLDSYWNLNLTNTHTETVTDQIYEEYKDTFDDMARHELEIWIRFHRYWLEQAERMPVLMVRYEDILTDMVGELTKIANFLEVDPHRVAAACQGDTHQLGSYRPRNPTVRFGKALGRYSKEILETFRRIDLDSPGWKHQTILEFFGYDLPNFPGNFEAGTVAPIPTVYAGTHQQCLLKINDGFQLRSPTDIYGRAMKQWRQSRTNNDQTPFPTVPR